MDSLLYLMLLYVIEDNNNDNNDTLIILDIVRLMAKITMINEYIFEG